LGRIVEAVDCPVGAWCLSRRVDYGPIPGRGTRCSTFPKALQAADATTGGPGRRPAQTAETHAQAVTTAAPKARLTQPTWFPDAIPREDDASGDQAQEADTAGDQVARPCQLMVAGGPAGVPGGKPWAGSAVSRPAATRPAP